MYDQVRYLDETGMEIVRVNFNNGQPAIVEKNKLQPKGQRYYFKDAITLDKDEIYVSPFDLNIEGQSIELPHKPMVRFSAPVFDRSGRTCWDACFLFSLRQRGHKKSGAISRPAFILSAHLPLRVEIRSSAG